MYTFFSILTACSVVVLTVLGARCGSVEKIKKYRAVNLWVAVSAALAGAVIPFAVYGMIFGRTADAEWQSWAWDAFLLFLKSTLPVCGIGLCLILMTAVVTAFVGKKANLFSAVVRQTASVAFSVLFLFMAPFYSAMAETSQASIHVFILLMGICQALLMRLTFVLEMTLRIKRKTAEKGPKKR